jgi:hypothetical protein
MRQKFLIFTSTLSLLFSISTSILWIRSHWMQDYAILGLNSSDTIFIFSKGGSLSFTGTGHLLGTRGERVLGTGSFEASEASIGVSTLLPPVIRLPGLAINRIDGWLNLPDSPSFPLRPIQFLQVYSVHWAWLTFPSAVFPFLYIAIRIRRRRRSPFACCTTCSYNLTGNTSGVCPECGTPNPEKSEVTP